VNEQELARWEALTARERYFWAQGVRVAGVDEVGRGPLAGPVVAAAVILPPGRTFGGLDDSKALTPRQRLALYRRLLDGGALIGVGAAGPRTIERLNILRASALAMERAVAALPVAPDWVLTDAVPLRLSVPVEALVEGDARSASVAAASVVAKVLRDRYMEALHAVYPAYGFHRHKGYATAAHWAALARHGPTPAHRRTFLARGRDGEPAAADSPPEDQGATRRAPTNRARQ
jgi:ribonuclease HII